MKSFITTVMMILLSSVANAATGWVTITNAQIEAVGKIAGTALGAVGPGQLDLEIVNTVAWPFASGETTVSPNQLNGRFYITGELNQEETNTQILVMLLSAWTHGKGLSLFISEDDGNSQYTGRAYIIAAIVTN